MKLITKILAASSLGAAGLAITPVAAQVQGNMGVVDAASVIASTNAFATASQQVNTTYKPQIDTIQQRGQEQQTLLKQLDKNNDGQLDEAEQKAAQGSSQAQRIQQIEQEVGQLSNQIEMARVYSIQQILQQYPAALQQVVQQLKIQFVLSPNSVVYAPPAANINQQVITALNGKVPSVQIVPPQDWQPTRNAVALYQEIQQLLAVAQARAAQQQAAQQNNPAPSGR